MLVPLDRGWGLFSPLGNTRRKPKPVIEWGKPFSK